MDVKNRTSHNFEGKGLSISFHPDAWRRIARGQVSGSTYCLTRHDGKFAVMKSEDIEILKLWGLNKGLVTQENSYSYTYWDDDLDRELVDYFDSMNEALDSWECDESDIEKTTILKPTIKLKTALAPIKICEHDPYQYLFGLYIKEHHPELDGVWFDHILDVAALSAPAGLIFDDKVYLWKNRILAF